MTNSLVSIAYAALSPITNWTYHDIDDILDKGNQLYQLLYPNRITQDNSTFLEIRDLNIAFGIGNKYFKSVTQEPCCGSMANSTTRHVRLPTLEEAVTTAFHICDTCIFILKDYGMSIQKLHTQFIVFDPHSRNTEGLFSPHGTAVCTILNSFLDLCKHLRLLGRS